MNIIEITVVVVIVTAIAVHLWRRRKQEPARVNEVYNGLSMLQRLAKSQGDLDRSHDLALLVEAIDEGRRLDIFPHAKADLDVTEVVRRIFLATDTLDALNLHGDNRRLCYQALLNLGERIRKRHLP